MAVDLASVIWSEVKAFIPSIDRQEAAEIVVSVMVDHDIDIEDIRQGFKGDSDVKRALTQYVKDHEDDGYDDDEDEDFYDEDEDEDY